MFNANDYFYGYEYKCFVKYILGEDDVAEGANVFCKNNYSLSLCKPGKKALDDALRYNEHPIWNVPTLYVTARVIPLLDAATLIQDMKSHEKETCVVVYYNKAGNTAVYIPEPARQAIVKGDYSFESLEDMLKNLPKDIPIVKKSMLKYFSCMKGIKKKPVKPKVCLCITSYRRIDQLIRQVFTFLTYAPKEAHLNVAVKGVTDEMFTLIHKPIFKKFIQEGRLSMRTFSNKGQLWNHVDSWMMSDIEKYDYFCKIDDDDFYAPEYAQDVIDIHSHFPFTLGGSFIRAKRHIVHTVHSKFFIDNVINEIHTRGELANTFVMSREVIKKLIAISKNPDKEVDKIEWAIANEDNIMQALLYAHGFVDRGAYIKTQYGDGYMYCCYNRTQGSTSNMEPDEGVYMSHVHALNRPPDNGNYGIGTESVLKLIHPEWIATAVIRNNTVCTDNDDNLIAGLVKSQDDSHITIYWPKWQSEEKFLRQASGIYVYIPNYGTDEASKKK